MSKPSSEQVPQMTTDELRMRLDDGASTVVLDIRPSEAYEEWHIPGSTNVPAYDALKRGEVGPLGDVSLPDDRPVVTVCGAGKTSRAAAKWLQRRGVEAYSLAGGLRAWTFAWNTADVRFSEMPARVVQVRRTGKGCLSYLVGSTGEAVVIDPALEPAVYRELAEQYGWRIAGVMDTHIHADHLSRARRLAEDVGVPLRLPAQSRVSYDFAPAADGDNLSVGAARIAVHHTPGHTPESVVYELEGHALFTGDTLFTRGVGRPDLDAGEDGAGEKARELYRSLQRLMTLEDGLLVLPGHANHPVAFDGTIVGASLGDVKRELAAHQWSEEQFVEEILDRVPPTPANHEKIIARNQTGEWPADESLEDLEAGANRCAVA